MENDSELVLERITEDGTFDELRKEIVERVKQDVYSWTCLALSLFNLHNPSSTYLQSNHLQYRKH